MSSSNVVEYTREQKDFTIKLFNCFPEVLSYVQDEDDCIIDSGGSFLRALDLFVRLVFDSIQSDDFMLARKILEMIEEFLETSDDESKEAMTVFFFETITNSLGWEDKKYMEIFVNLLGKHSKECCRKVDELWGTKTPGL